MSDAFIYRFDQPFARFDAGLQFDVTVGPSPGDVAKYLALLTSQHRGKPRLEDTIDALVSGPADAIAIAATLQAKHDLDVAAGQQLDVIGQWVGLTRFLRTPLNDVFFSLDVDGLGFDEGYWYTPGPLAYFSLDVEGHGFDQVPWAPPGGASTGPVAQFQLQELDDEAYRLLLRARIANNAWNGTTPGAIAVWDVLFAAQSYNFVIQDRETMHILMAITGERPDAVTRALFKGGYLNLKPAGVQVDVRMIPAEDNVPYFGFDQGPPQPVPDTFAFDDPDAGFDDGQWDSTPDPGPLPAWMLPDNPIIRGFDEGYFGEIL